MSTYDDASLVMIPSGYKTGTVFSQKPMSTDGQLTFTRSNDTATRVASNGLIEKVRTNLFTYSEQFDNAAWTKVDTTIVANAVVNPLNGAVTADKITDSSTATTARYFFQSPASIGTIYTSSGYFKKAEYNFVTLHAFGLNGAVFNLDTGVKVSQSGGVGTITSVGDGWYRCTFSFTAGGSAAFFSQSPAGNIIYAGTTGSGIYAFGCQLETGDIATDYIPTTTAAVSVGPVANVPRLDYLGSTCPRLLLEPQRTNLFNFSENFDNAAWIKMNASVTANQAVSPDGYTNADLLTNNATNDLHQIYGDITTGIGAQSFTCYAKANTLNFVGLYNASAIQGAFFNLTTGAVSGNIVNAPTSASAVNVGNGWYRISITVSTLVAASRFQIILSENGTAFLYAGTNKSAYIWGAQLETGAYATSYIPTLAASVTRGADACSKTGISSLIGQTEGVLFADFTINGLLDYGTISVNNGTTAQYIWLAIFGNGTLRAQLNNGSAQATITYSGAVVGGRYKMAFGYKTNDFVLYVNGIQVGTDNVGTTFSGTTLSRFDTDLANASFYSTASESINQALLFKTRLPNSELASLTTL